MVAGHGCISEIYAYMISFVCHALCVTALASGKIKGMFPIALSFALIGIIKAGTHPAAAMPCCSNVNSLPRAKVVLLLPASAGPLDPLAVVC